MLKTNSRVPSVVSAGWVLPQTGGGWAGGEICETPAGGVHQLFESEITERMEVKNAGRFPEGTRSVCAACALAFRAAGIWPEGDIGRNTGVLIAGYDHTLLQNSDFFKDYVDHGRVMARGKLFIYTLPTSAVAEAAILFNLEGPLLFEESDYRPFAGLVSSGSDLVVSGQARRMVLLWQDREATLCVLLDIHDGSLSSKCLAEVAGKWNVPGQGINYFRNCYGDTISEQGSA